MYVTLYIYIYIYCRGDCGGVKLSGLQPCILLKRFLMRFFFKINTKYSSGNLACSCVGFSFHSYSKLMQNAPSTVLPPPVVVSHAIIIQNCCKMRLRPCCLLLWWFLNQFLFKMNTKCSSGNLASSCDKQ